jgi:hypothetical protein
VPCCVKDWDQIAEFIWTQRRFFDGWRVCFDKPSHLIGDFEGRYTWDRSFKGDNYSLMLRKSSKLFMVSKAQPYHFRTSFDASFPEGIPSEQKAKDLLRMNMVVAPRRTIFYYSYTLWVTSVTQCYDCLPLPQ